MKKAIGFLVFAAIVIAGGPAEAKGAKGSNWTNPESISVGSSKKVATLVAEIDPEVLGDKDADPGDEYTGNYVYYFKFTGKRGNSYTVTVEGAAEGNEIELDVSDVGCYDFDKDVSCPSFEVTDDPDGYNQRAYLYGEDWDSEDDGSVTYYIQLLDPVFDPDDTTDKPSPSRNLTVTLYGSIVEPKIPKGRQDNPDSLDWTKGTSPAVPMVDDGSYYYTTTLTAERKYLFATTGGTEASRPTLEIYEDESLPEGPSRRMYAPWTNAWDDAWSVIPSCTGKHWVQILAEGSAKIGLKYKLLPALKPTQHAFKTLAAPAAGNTATLTLDDPAPGHRNKAGSEVYDKVIDEALVKLPALSSGNIYSFTVSDTAQKTVARLVEVYDKDGKIVVSGKSEGEMTVSFKPAADGDYWVGVCEDLEDDEVDEPTYLPCVLTVGCHVKGDGLVDEWDPKDDTRTHASALDPAAAEEGDLPIDRGTAHGDAEHPHYFGVTDWKDIYRIDATKDLTYVVQTKLLDDAPVSDPEKWKLSARVVDAAGKTVEVIDVTDKKVTEVEDLGDGFRFTPTKSGAYYVEVWVRNAPGMDYGPYALYSLAYGADKLGRVHVDIAGPTAEDGAAWWFTGDVDKKGNPTVTYGPGANVLKPLKEGYKVAFAAVKGWSKVGNRDVVFDGDGKALVSVKYNDDHDDEKDDAKAGDGSPSGKKVTELKPGKAAKVSRSLWESDAADWYKFTTTASAWYDFTLDALSTTGDAILELFASDKTTLLATGTSVRYLSREAKKTFWLRVRHLDAANPADSRYTLIHSVKVVGTIGFDKAAVSVKKGAASVALTVKRTGGKEGVVRVRYTTTCEGYSARPGEQYYPQTNVLTWANGDAKNKTVTIRLIPQLTAKYTGNLDFAVKLLALEPADLAADELVPPIKPSVAVVTITDNVKKSSGTVQFGAWGDDEEVFANAKKPAAGVRAGDELKLRLDRVGGSDGTVGVTVTPTGSKSGAAADVDFEAEPVTLVWENGDDASKFFTLKTIDAGDANGASKALTVKLSADKTQDSTAKLGAAVTVTVTDPNVTRTFADYAASYSKSSGLVLKAGKGDPWYFGAEGLLRSPALKSGGKAELTLTLTGPGKFVCNPSFENGGNAGNKATITIDKKTWQLSDEGEEIVHYVTKKSTVKVTVTQAKNAKEEAFVTFADTGTGLPFAWKLLPTLDSVAPLSGATAVAEEEEEDSENVYLVCTDAEDPDIGYLFYADADKKKLGTDKAEYGTGTGVSGYLTEARFPVPVQCGDCGGAGLIPGKTYYWRAEPVFVDEEGVVMLRGTSSAAWSFKVLETGAPAVTLAGGTGAGGEDLSTLANTGAACPVTLVQGVQADIVLGGADAYSALTKLPAGLSVKGARVVGAPSKAGETVVLLQGGSLDSKKKFRPAAAGTLAVRFIVEKPQLASGTFNGLVTTEDERLLRTDGGKLATTASQKLGSVKVTTTDAGKITATVAFGKTSYKFTGGSWSAAIPFLENGQPGVTVCLSNTVKATVNKKSRQLVNVLTLTACRGATADWEAIGTPMAVKLVRELVSADGKSVMTDVVHTGLARRDNAKLKDVVAAEGPFVGYYTVSLPVVTEDAVSGRGYLTVTLDKKGTAKTSGLLADGTKVSASAVAAYVPEGDNEAGEPEIHVPVYYGKDAVAFGGWLKFRLAEVRNLGTGTTDELPVACADARLHWINAATSATHDGQEGFLYEVEPTGGYYNTIYSLQRYYLDFAFTVDKLDEDELPDELLGGNDHYVCYPGLLGPDVLSLVGNAFSLPKASRPTVSGNKNRYDWAKAVNPSGLTLSFKRATGITSGQFEIYADSGKKDVKLGAYKHNGVLILSREAREDAALDANVAIPGFFQVPVKVTTKRTWTASLPFDVVTEAVDNDWSEPAW